MTVDLSRLRAGYERARDELLAERTPAGHWIGELSSSALSTATAVSALALVQRGQSSGFSVQDSGDRRRATGGRGPESELNELIQRGVAWLADQQNGDGGFGDTDLSHSNIATTYLVVAALHLAGVAGQHRELLKRANAYIDSQGRLQGLRKRYGIDKTFVVPIMTNLALAGLVDWREIDPLPFELACVPQSWYRFVGMPVVSYAIPALVAIGQARYFHLPPRNPITRFIRRLSINRSLRVLRRMQPDSGGYLEATPLTSFVVMSLASQGSGIGVQGSVGEVQGSRFQVPGSKFWVQGRIADEVIRAGVKFLVDSARPDGSWPIDTNLATWNTTLAINALAGAGEDVVELLGPKCLDWLLSCQQRQRHPFTGADPGGFGWSDLSGAVPDADDTPGAVLAVESFWSDRRQDHDSAKRTIDRHCLASNWLRGLQNRDGGWPTFCRGWGKLPFDRSGSDLTAHALRALTIVVRAGELLAQQRNQLGSGPFAGPIERGLDYLRGQQQADGSWSPLWFGNQDHLTEDNPIYGTAKVLMAYRDLGLMDSAEAQRGVAWLVANQNSDGGWGSGVWSWKDEGGRMKDERQNAVEANLQPPSPEPLAPSPFLSSSVEETALAVEALLAACPPNASERRNATEGVPYSAGEKSARQVLNPDPRTLNPEYQTPNPGDQAVARGLNWLLDRVEQGQHRQPAPIGFYFAKLWYYEKLYPLTFTVAALGRACRQFAHPASDPLPAQPAADAP